MPSAGKEAARRPRSTRASLAGPPCSSSTLIRPLPTRLVHTLKVPGVRGHRNHPHAAGAHARIRRGRSSAGRALEPPSAAGRPSSVSGAAAPVPNRHAVEHDRAEHERHVGMASVARSSRRAQGVRHYNSSLPEVRACPTRRSRPSATSTASGARGAGAADDVEHQRRLARQRRLRRRPVRSRASRPTSTCTASGRSARPQGLHMRPPVTAEQIEALAREGIAQFPADTPLYIRPMFWAESGMVLPDPDSTQFALVITRMSLPDPAKGFSACLSTYRRPSPEQAPTHAKAACLYPLAGLAIAQATRARLRQRGDVRSARQRRRADRAEHHVRQGRRRASRRFPTAPSSTASPASG